jgi:divalent metal cation (Fe/Co/Zn/Cd) transporter
MRFSNKIEILKYADKVATVVVGLFIIKVGFDVLKENISTILGEQEIDQEYLENIKRIITDEKEVICIDELNLIKYGYYFKIVCEVGMNGNLSLKKSHSIVEKIETKLKEYDDRNKYITIHVNPYDK